MPTAPPTLSVAHISAGQFTPPSQSDSSHETPGFVAVDTSATVPAAPRPPAFSVLGHFTGVLLQQGRVQLDNDWNETRPRKFPFPPPPPPPFVIAGVNPSGVNLPPVALLASSARD